MVLPPNLSYRESKKISDLWTHIMTNDDTGEQLLLFSASGSTARLTYEEIDELIEHLNKIKKSWKN